MTPSNALNTSGKHTARCIYLHSIENFLDPSVQDIIGPADVIVAQRNLISQSVWDFCDYWRGMGKLVIADLDDAYQMMPWSNPAHRFWEQNAGKLDRHPVDALKEGLLHVDGLMTPSKRLCEDWADIVPSYWLPNWAEGSWYKDLSQKEFDPDRTIVGWGGSVSHYDSWWGSEIRQGLRKLCERFPQVVVKICGNDKRIYDQLPVPDAQKIHQVGVKPEDWPRQVNSFDIGIAPLHGDYDQRRSWIKALEYLLVGIPWVVTQGRPYAEFAGADSGIQIPNSADAWFCMLSEIVGNYATWKARAVANRHIGFENTMEQNIDRYVDTYNRASAVRRNKSLPGIVYVNWAGTGSEAESGDGTRAEVA